MLSNVLSGRTTKLVVALALVCLLGLAVFWLLAGPHGKGQAVGGGSASSTNPALDLRFNYDPAVFKVGPYDGAAEFPLRLDSADFSIYGKRIQGIGAGMTKDPGPILYDFIGSQHAEVYEYWYKLKPEGEPDYEDVTLFGHLGLHQKLAYRRVADSKSWPSYFPASIRGEADENGKHTAGAELAYLEAWTFFSKEDLYFFYAIAPKALTPQQRDECLKVISSMQFNALQGKGAPTAGEDSENKDKDGAEAEEPSITFRPKQGPGSGPPPGSEKGNDPLNGK